MEAAEEGFGGNLQVVSARDCPVPLWSAERQHFYLSVHSFKQWPLSILSLLLTLVICRAKERPSQFGTANDKIQMFRKR